MVVTIYYLHRVRSIVATFGAVMNSPFAAASAAATGFPKRAGPASIPPETRYAAQALVPAAQACQYCASFGGG